MKIILIKRAERCLSTAYFLYECYSFYNHNEYVSDLFLVYVLVYVALEKRRVIRKLMCI